MTKKTTGAILQYVIILGLVAGLLYWQSRQMTAADRNQMFDAIIRVKDRWYLIIPVIIVGFLSHLFRALRWKILLEPLNLYPTTINITCAVFVGYLGNLLLPRMGEVAKCTVLAKYEKEPPDKIIGTIVAERGFDIVCLVIVAALTFLIQIDLIGNYTKELIKGVLANRNAMIITALVIVAVVVAMVVIYRRSKGSKVGHFIQGIGEGVKSILEMKKRWTFIMYTVLIWGSYLTLIWIGFKGVSETQHLGLAAGLAVLVFGAIGMILTPGGLGAYPLSVKIVLVKLYFIGSNVAYAYGWIAWIAQTGIILVFGLLALVVLPIYNRVPHGEITVDKK